MRTLFTLLLCTACSNAKDTAIDAAVIPVDTAKPIDSSVSIDAPQALRLLVVNEVAPGETPDWIEVVNATNAPIQLDQFVYVDVAGDFVKAKPFPAMMLAPGAYYVQNIDDTVSGFKLGSDEEVWVYRASDQALSDGVDWAEGAAPMGSSYARSPTITGAFATTATPSKGTANP
ncbi:MAG TPA: hypothetical protein VIV11_01095 [Kofleriaceae bacterium]